MTDNLQKILAIVKEQNLNVSEVQSIPAELIIEKQNRSDNLPIVKVESNGMKQDIQHDYNFVRSNLHNLIEKGTIALDNIIRIAENSEKAFAFETVTTIMKTLIDTNKEIIDLHKTMIELDAEKEQEKQKGEVNIKNAVFVGSTAELGEMIKKSKEEISSDDDLF